MSDSRPLNRRAKFILLCLFGVLSVIWPLVVPAEALVQYTYMMGAVFAAGIGFQAGVDWQKAKAPQ